MAKAYFHERRAGESAAAGADERVTEKPLSARTLSMPSEEVNAVCDFGAEAPWRKGKNRNALFKKLNKMVFLTK